MAKLRFCLAVLLCCAALSPAAAGATATEQCNLRATEDLAGQCFSLLAEKQGDLAVCQAASSASVTQVCRENLILRLNRKPVKSLKPILPFAEFITNLSLQITIADPEHLIDLGHFKNLEFLGLSLGMNELPPVIKTLPKLRRLSLSGKQMTAIPEVVFDLSELTSLDLRSSGVTQLSDDIANLQKLEQLKLMNNPIDRLPAGLFKLARLKRLDLSGTDIENLDERIGQLRNLESFRFQRGKIKQLPAGFYDLTSLRELDLSKSRVTRIDPKISQLTNLEVLILSRTPIRSLPDSIASLEKLSTLDISNTSIRNLDEKIILGTKPDTLNLRGTDLNVRGDLIEQLTYGDSRTRKRALGQLRGQKKAAMRRQVTGELLELMLPVTAPTRELMLLGDAVVDIDRLGNAREREALVPLIAQHANLAKSDRGRAQIANTMFRVAVRSVSYGHAYEPILLKLRHAAIHEQETGFQMLLGLLARQPGLNEAVNKAFDSENSALRELALRVVRDARISLSDDMRKQIVNWLGDDDPELVALAGKQLLDDHSTNLDSLLLASLDHPDPKVQVQVISLLGQSGDPNLTANLRTLLDHPDSRVFSASTEAMAVLTGQTFGEDKAAWETWFRSMEESCLAAGPGENAPLAIGDAEAMNIDKTIAIPIYKSRDNQLVLHMRVHQDSPRFGDEEEFLTMQSAFGFEVNQDIWIYRHSEKATVPNRIKKLKLNRAEIENPNSGNFRELIVELDSTVPAGFNQLLINHPLPPQTWCERPFFPERVDAYGIRPEMARFYRFKRLEIPGEEYVVALREGNFGRIDPARLPSKLGRTARFMLFKRQAEHWELIKEGGLGMTTMADINGDGLPEFEFSYPDSPESEIISILPGDNPIQIYISH